MLPTFTGGAGPRSASAPRRRRPGAPKEGSLWGLLTTLLLSLACLVVTRQRSLAAAPAARRELLAGAAGGGGGGAGDGEEPTPLREDPETFQAAARSFDARLHALYPSSAPPPPASDDALSGGWDFSAGVYDAAARHPAADVLSDSAPRLVLFRSFLSPAEVGHLVAVARDHLERSQVLTANVSDAVDNVRTSFGAWPPRDGVLDAVNARIHALVGVPREFGEDIYVLNYQLGQRYDAHHDNCMDSLDGDRTADDACLPFLQRAGGPGCGPGEGGPTCGDRVATFILYLKAPTQGGHTVFPDAQLTSQRMLAARKRGDGGDAWYCGADVEQEVLGVAPAAGDGVLFWDFEPGEGPGTGSFRDGTAQPAANPVGGALHAGCPVLAGEKWIATRWIRGAQFT